MGCVLPAGIGQAPARQASIGAGIPTSVGAVTVNKVCGSGLKAVVFGRNAIALGEDDMVVAGGMESMSNAPYLLPKARDGSRMGHAQVMDSMIHDGLWDAYDNVHMGDCAELCAKEKGISRAAQDEFAAESYRRAPARRGGPVPRRDRPGRGAAAKGRPWWSPTTRSPGEATSRRWPRLRPAFQKDGTVTAGNASSINDGAAALVLVGADAAEARGLQAGGADRRQRGRAQAPEWFTTAPADAIERLLTRDGWKQDDVDLWEINEAFAVVSIANNQLLGAGPREGERARRRRRARAPDRRVAAPASWSRCSPR